MMVWKMIFLFQGCILRLHANLPGCSRYEKQLAPFCCLLLLPPFPLKPDGGCGSSTFPRQLSNRQVTQCPWQRIWALQTFAVPQKSKRWRPAGQVTLSRLWSKSHGLRGTARLNLAAPRSRCLFHIDPMRLIRIQMHLKLTVDKQSQYSFVVTFEYWDCLSTVNFK